MEAYRNVNLPPEERAADLLDRMTLREKVGQLTQRLYGFACYERQGGDIRLTEEFYREADRYGGIGALYGLYRADPWSGRDFDTGLDGALAPRARNMVQRYLVEHTRLGIPALMTTECPHGHQALDGCLLPVNLASASTWSPALLEEAAKVCARQLRAMGVDLALVSALDILRDPRWGRSEECFGEDPVLAAAFAGAVVRGYRSQGVDVTAKHLCAQGETTGGVNASAARIGPRELREIHLPAVRACVEAGAASFMAAYNEIDGVYCHANPWLLRNLLREEYGFTGVVMSDGVAIDQLDAVTGDRTASGALALASGVDLGLWDSAFGHLEEAVERGLVSSAQIDEAAARVLELKFRRGLFEEPYIPEDSRWQGYTPETHPQVKRLAEESVVLLKNENGILPLDKSAIKTIGVIGPNANNRKALVGNYEGTASRYWTISEGIQEYLGEEVRVMFSEGCHLYRDRVETIGDRNDRMAEVKGVCDCSDLVVVCLGLDAGLEGEQGDANNEYGSGDKPDLGLPGLQQEVLKAVVDSKKPVVLVLLSGSALGVDWAQDHVPAIIQGWYPGAQGGMALAELLFGDRCPEGKLPVTFYHADHVLPDFTDYSMKERTYRYMTGEALYPFGYGLSYTTFAYKKATADKDQVTEEGVTIRVSVKNTGARAGAETVQAYVKIHREGTPNAQLKGICKLRLSPGEEGEALIHLPARAFGLYSQEGKLLLQKGRASVSIGGQGPDPRSRRLTGQEVQLLEFEIPQDMTL